MDFPGQVGKPEIISGLVDILLGILPALKHEEGKKQKKEQICLFDITTQI
jgi:hypothetical protein